MAELLQRTLLEDATCHESNAWHEQSPSGVKASACDGSTSDSTRPMHRPSGSCKSKSLSHDVVAIGLVGKGSHDATMESGLARVSRYLKFCGVQTCNGLIWNRNDDSLLVLVVGWQLLLDGDC